MAVAHYWPSRHSQETRETANSMQRLHFERSVRWPFRAATAISPALLFALILAACSDSPFEPVESAVPALAALNPSAPSEPFDGFDTAVWNKQEHVLGRGWLLASNVTVESSQLRLWLDANGYEGGEIASRAPFGLGSFAARLRCGAPTGALCAFFLYQPNAGDRADEIDIEILGGTREIWFTTWSRGRRTNHAARVLTFDPAAAAHQYAIVRTSSSVAFYVDGKELARFRKRLPIAEMALLVNAWWPSWLTPAAGATGSLDVDWIDWS
jgi:beta-glucanase (GH16 family)